MPTSLTCNEVERLKYAFRYIQQYGLCGPEDNVYNYFSFSDQEQHRWRDFWCARYDMTSQDLTQENLSQYVSLGVPFGGLALEKNPGRIYLNDAIDRISEHEFHRYNNLIWGFGLQTSKDRLLVYSKILQSIYDLNPETKPSKRLIALINVCDKLAKDERHQYSSRQKDNFKTVLSDIRDYLFVSLGTLTADELSKTYSNSVKKAFNFLDKNNTRLVDRYNLDTSAYEDSLVELEDSYHLRQVGENETVTTKLKQAKNALLDIVQNLEAELEIADSAYAYFSDDSWWSYFLGKDEDPSKEQKRVWDQMKKSLVSFRHDTSDESISKHLKAYLRSLNDTIIELRSQIDTMEVLSKIKLPRTQYEREVSIRKVLEDKKISGNFARPLGEEYLDVSKPKNPFRSEFARLHRSNKVRALLEAS
ncbi:hypothetical protein L3V86_00545 [Thiotrichales bacterium 19S11-10]|nr:hypothetical protein [Thiotrichales bacterium 19S11-10]